MAVERRCEWCGKALTKRQKRFCSHKCANLGRCGEDHPNWKGGKVEKTCKQCGKEFCTILSEVKRGKGIFCSLDCRWEYQRGENSPSWKGGEAKITCEQCGKEFSVKRARMDTRRFCSRKCVDLWRAKTICGENHPNWKGKIKKVCKQCGEEFDVYPYHGDEARFCSRACQGKWKSENIRGETNPLWEERIKKICKQCGQEFEVIPYSANVKIRKFCSQDCYWKWQAENRCGEKAANWQGGLSFEPYGIEFNDKLKELIRERDDYTCAISGEVWQSGQMKFPVHHIDYNKKNNDPANLITLSLSLHARTNFNRCHWQTLLTPIARGAEMRRTSFV